MFSQICIIGQFVFILIFFYQSHFIVAEGNILYGKRKMFSTLLWIFSPIFTWCVCILYGFFTLRICHRDLTYTRTQHRMNKFNCSYAFCRHHHRHITQQKLLPRYLIVSLYMLIRPLKRIKAKKKKWIRCVDKENPPQRIWLHASVFVSVHR